MYVTKENQLIIVEECFNQNNNTRAHEEENYFWKGHHSLCGDFFQEVALPEMCFL